MTLPAVRAARTPGSGSLIHSRPHRARRARVQRAERFPVASQRVLDAFGVGFDRLTLKQQRHSVLRQAVLLKAETRAGVLRPWAARQVEMKAVGVGAGAGASPGSAIGLGARASAAAGETAGGSAVGRDGGGGATERATETTGASETTAGQKARRRWRLSADGRCRGSRARRVVSWRHWRHRPRRRRYRNLGLRGAGVLSVPGPASGVSGTSTTGGGLSADTSGGVICRPH